MSDHMTTARERTETERNIAIAEAVRAAWSKRALDAKDAEIARLTVERDEALTEHTDMMWQRRRADERAEAAEARNAKLEGVLRQALAEADQTEDTWAAACIMENAIRAALASLDQPQESKP